MDSFRCRGPLVAGRQGPQKQGATKRITLACCLIIGSLALFFAPVLGQERLERVTLAVPVHALSQLPAYVGARFGLFREEGIDVQLIQMRTALVGPALIGRDLPDTEVLVQLQDDLRQFIREIRVIQVRVSVENSRHPAKFEWGKTNPQ